MDEGTLALHAATVELTDAEFAVHIRGMVMALNTAVELAAQRSLIVAYRIKEGQKTDGVVNPRLIVSVMVEVA